MCCFLKQESLMSRFPRWALANFFATKTLLGAIAVASMLMAATAFAAKPAADIPLLLTFGSPGDALRSDSRLAPGYVADYAHGLENVLAILQPSGNFRFSTHNDTKLAVQRRMCFDFGAQPVPFAPAQCVDVEQPMHAFPTGDVPAQSLRYGGSVKKLTRFAWDDGAYRYRLGYGTDMDMDGVQDSPAVNATCIAPADTTQPCSTWVLAPETDGTAALFRFPLQRSGKSVLEGSAQYVGSYVMPFVETFTLK